MKAFASLTLMAWLTACGDPVHVQQLVTLGSEESGVPEGPLHRPGQPCAVCHGERGPAERSFVLSGTVYRTPTGRLPLPGVSVRLLDASGAERSVETNCAGNFYLTAEELAPVYPLWVKLEYGDAAVEMRSPISRERSCAACHAQPAGPTSVGQVYFWPDDEAQAEVAPCD